MSFAMIGECVFGYGSLVNRSTHDYPDCRQAVLMGWRRVWRHTDLRPLAFLTSEPCEGAEIEGLTVRIPSHDWPLLDRREAAYARSDVTLHLRQDEPRHRLVHVYAIGDGVHGRPAERFPILLSYLDVVVQGYLNEFGEAGVARFFATTTGWEAPLRNDRRDPVYARHRALRPVERDLVDQYVRSLGMTVV